MKTFFKAIFFALMAATLPAQTTMFMWSATAGQVTPAAPSGGPGVFSSVTDSGLTNGRFVLAGTGGLLVDDADIAYNSTAVLFGNGLTDGLQFYNTVDQTTNYERFQILYSGNSVSMRSVKGGSGTVRAISFGVTGVHAIDIGATITEGISFGGGSSSNANTNQNTFIGTSTATSGTNTAVRITPTYNQASGTAANDDLRIARVETALGSGAQNFINLLAGAAGATQKFAINNLGVVTFYGGAASLNVVAVRAAGTITATSNARAAAAATYTVGAADGTFVISGNVNVTTSTTHSFSLDCVYTDETNASRTLVMPMAQLAGSFVATGLITNVTGAGPYESAAMTIRCKAATSITIRPSAGGTYTAVVYNTTGNIRQVD